MSGLIFRRPTKNGNGWKSRTLKTAQIILRFLIQSDVIVIPKSTKQERMKENLDIFDFELSAAEMQTIQALDKKKSYSGWPASMQEF